MENLRGSGRSTAQLLIAPKDATFVCLNDESRWYALQLAWHLGRSDLKIACASRLGEPDRFRGLRVVLDHAVVERMSQLSQRERAGAVALLEMGVLY